jgi:hypothetical protein
VFETTRKNRNALLMYDFLMAQDSTQPIDKPKAHRHRLSFRQWSR